MALLPQAAQTEAMRTTTNTVPDQNVSTSPSASTVIISREGERTLRDELSALLADRTQQLPRRLQRAREFGGATENDDYLQIMEEEAVSSARIASIRQILAMATVVDVGSEPDGGAVVGSLVTLRMDGKLLKRRLLGAHEPIGRDGFSVASPIGQAILGRHAGETTLAELPGERFVRIELLAVDHDDAEELDRRRKRVTA